MPRVATANLGRPSGDQQLMETAAATRAALREMRDYAQSLGRTVENLMQRMVTFEERLAKIEEALRKRGVRAVDLEGT